MSWKKSVKSPICLGISTNALCTNISSRQSKSQVCFPNCLSKSTSWHSVRLMLLKLRLSLPVFTDVAFTCYQNDCQAISFHAQFPRLKGRDTSSTEALTGFHSSFYWFNFDETDISCSRKVKNL